MPFAKAAMRGAVLLCLVWLQPVAANEHRPAASAERVEAARQKLYADPALASKKTVGMFKRARYATDGIKSPAVPPLFDLLRIAVWGLGGVLVAWGIWRFRSWTRIRPASPETGLQEASVRHGQPVGLRPETLPAQPGAQALSLWRAGDHRAALSLLYRGLLSRLVEVHGIPLTAASTERDCIRLTRAVLPAGLQHDVEELVGAWQLCVFGGRVVDATRIESLCQRFDEQFACPPRSGAERLS